MRLYYKPGACSLATHIALREIGADFTLESVDTDTQKTETGADFKAVNAKGYVPALRLADGEVITENPAILQYLAELLPASALAPAPGALERARLQEWLGYLNSELHKAYSPFFSARPPSGAEREAVSAKLAEKIGFIDRHLSDGRPHLLGQQFTIADAYAFAILNWSGPVGFDLAPFPSAERFIEGVGKRPAVQAAMRAEGLIR